MIRLQPFQTSFNGPEHILAMVAAEVGICRTFTQGVFSGDHKTVPVGGGEFSDKFLARPIGIVVGCVNVITPGLQKCIENFAALSFCRTPTPVITKCHCTET